MFSRMVSYGEVLEFFKSEKDLSFLKANIKRPHYVQSILGQSLTDFTHKT